MHYLLIFGAFVLLLSCDSQQSKPLEASAANAVDEALEMVVINGWEYKRTNRQPAAKAAATNEDWLFAFLDFSLIRNIDGYLEIGPSIFINGQLYLSEQYYNCQAIEGLEVLDFSPPPIPMGYVAADGNANPQETFFPAPAADASAALASPHLYSGTIEQNDADVYYFILTEEMADETRYGIHLIKGNEHIQAQLYWPYGQGNTPLDGGTWWGLATPGVYYVVVFSTDPNETGDYFLSLAAHTDK